LDALARGVQVRLLFSFNVATYIENTKTALDFCRPINLKTGYTACALEERHNSIFGSMHQKAAVIKRNGEVVAYVGSMDVAAPRWDTHLHNQDRNWQIEPKFGTSFYGWTGGMVMIKGPAVVDIARHMYDQFNDPSKPALTYKISPVDWPDIKPVIYPTTTKVQALFTAGPAGAIKYGYYANWAPRGELSILNATLKAIQNAHHYIFISDQDLWYPPILDAVYAALDHVDAVYLVQAPFFAFDFSFHGFNFNTIANAKEYFQYQALQKLLSNSKVHLFALNKEGTQFGIVSNLIYPHWKLLFVDDVFAIIGSAGVEQSGMTNDLDMSVGIYDPDVVKHMRKQIWAEYLNVDDNDPRLDDPIGALNTLWLPSSENMGRVRAYHPNDIEYHSVYSLIFHAWEPCGLMDSTKCL
jgi:phosphatidylserine/phosphatidylglycerophosphate/cardiolipin synthase-like enzyme